MNELIYRLGPQSPHETAIFDGLISSTFDGPAGSKANAPGAAWHRLGIFVGDKCVAAALLARRPLVCDRSPVPVGLLSSVCVAEAQRGRGWFRRLMDHALRWFDNVGCATILLFAEESALYERFGFKEIAQHAFVEPMPQRNAATFGPRGCPPATAATIERLVRSRAPLSHRVYLDAPDLVVAFCASCLSETDPAYELVFLPALDSLVVLGREPVLTLVDVIAPSMPTMDDLLAHLGRTATTVRTLFPPDRLSWTGTPVAEPNGLMARGRLTAACAEPFMLPPTVEF